MNANLPAPTPAARTKNIVISGTNFWNPGDDFVRDGVIRVLQEVFAGETLNFLFYNFNADFFPQNKFTGIANFLAQGDLEKCRDFVDAVVIAGLSAGDEVKDLYRWIVANGLEHKVYLIGAGYENSYVDQHVLQEPEATIFRKARVILGRTRKTPPFIQTLATPYFHVNCPAILSVPEVKAVPPGKTIQRIGFSLQLPHDEAAVNHGCAREQYELGLAVLRELARDYSVEVVAHHKTEYFHFLNLLRNENIPVIFSSFYQDLHGIYPRYDLIITTRLHSSLFANGHGIPGIILNHTDRHTHALEGFQHSEWVGTLAGFQSAFQKICRRNLVEIRNELQTFKRELLAQYVSILRVICLAAPNSAAAYSFDSEKKEQALVRALVRPGMVTFDVGANIGKYTKLFSLLVGDAGKVFAFEADPRSAQRVRKLATDDGLANVTVINQAVAEQPGKVTLNQFPDEYCSWNSLGRPRMEDPRNPSQFVPIVGSVEVDAVTLDDFCAKHNIARVDYLKLDVEGAEFRALLGSRNLLQRQAIRFLQFEVSAKMLEGLNTCAKPVFDLLASFGYECRAISEQGEILGRVSDSREFYENYIAIPSPASWLNESFLNSLLGELHHPDHKRRVLGIISRLEKDYWLERNLVRYQDAGAWFDTATLLNWIGRLWQPRNYLEIGVRRGRSMAQVLVESPATEAYGFDLWIPDYGSDSQAGIQTTNPGPEFVLAELGKFGLPRLPHLVRGDSHVTVPAFFQDPAHPQKFELILVDGDHSADGAGADLEMAFAHLAPGGIVLFDDICNSAHPELRAVWDEFAERYPDYLFINDHTGAGTGVAFSPPFDRLKAIVQSGAAPAVNPAAFPVHFFTIVLNGLPFLRHHIDAFKQLPFAWHWHIIEGVADLNHDTCWSRATGGRIPAGLHRAGLSVDGTTEYLDTLKAEFPDNITIYRPPAGKFWDGKREMVNAPMANLHQECLLWQVDADELWTTEQILRTRSLFLDQPDKTAALFRCHYFVGRDLIVTSHDTYGNYANEWLRVWRFQPGDQWQTHEPPRLCRGTVDVGALRPIRQAETQSRGLVFQHYAYATEAQLRFKESYYGYPGAVAQWRALQQVSQYPLRLAVYFQWVKDEAIVDTIHSQGLQRLAPDEWFPAEITPGGPLDGADRILFVRTDAIGDAVLASGMLELIQRKYPQAKLGVLCQHHVAHLFLACPWLDTIVCYDVRKMADPVERQQIVNEIAAFKPDVILNSVRSRDHLSNELALAYADARHIAIEPDLNNCPAADQAAANARYELISSPAGPRAELDRHADFLRGLGIETASPQPAVWTSPEDEALAEAFFQQQGLDSSRTIAVFPGAQHQVRIYSRYVEVLKTLADFRFLIFGDATQNDLAEKIVAGLPGRSVNLCGRTSLLETAALLRRCRLYVGAESAGAHIACAVGLQNVVLLGGGHFGRFMPYSPLTTAVCQPLECFGCNWRCQYASPHCIAGIQPETVAAALAKALAGPGSQPLIFAQTNPQKIAEKVFENMGQNRWLTKPAALQFFIPSHPISPLWPSLQLGAGVHKEEGDFRWLDPEAELLVNVPLGGLPAHLSFELRAGLMTWYPRPPLRVAVTLNGQSQERLCLQTDYQFAHVRLHLAPASRPYSIRIRTDQFFVGADPGRHLAVQLRQARVTEASAVIAPPATQASDWDQPDGRLKFAPSI